MYILFFIYNSFSIIYVVGIVIPNNILECRDTVDLFNKCGNLSQIKCLMPPYV